MERDPHSPVDATMLAYLQSLSVEERVDLNDSALRLIEELRAGYAAVVAAKHDADVPDDR